jgi:hypothetical protein
MSETIKKQNPADCPENDRFMDTSGGRYRLTASFKCRFQSGFYVPHSNITEIQSV